MTVDQPIMVSYHGIDFDSANFSRNVQSKHNKKKNNRLIGAKIGQEVSLNKHILLYSMNDLRIAVKL